MPPIPRCGSTCCATGGAPRACAGCGRCSTTASRSTARSWCARASTTAPVLDDTLAGVLDQYPELASLCVVPLGVSPVQPRAAHAAAHADEARGVRRRGRRLAGRLPRVLGSPPGVRRRRVLPAGRPPVPAGRRVRGLPHARGRHRHGPHVRARVHGRRRRRDRRSARVLRLGRRRAGRTGYRAPHAGRPIGGRRDECVSTRARRSSSQRRSAILTGAYGAAGPRARSSRGLGRDDVRVVPVDEPLLRRQHRRSPACWWARTSPGCWPPSPRPPLPAARRLPVRRSFLDGTTVADLPRPVEIVADRRRRACATRWRR